MPQVPPPGEFRVSAETGGEGALVRLSGELDIATAPHLEDELNGLLDRGVRHVTLDLAELSFMDSKGLHALVRARERLAGRQGDLVVQAPSPNARRILEISGLDRLIRVD
jgi:anti-sigma B factor antagonist